MPKPEKISLIQMILYAEDEIRDVDIWQSVLETEGSPLYPRMAHRREVMRKIAATLELVKLHEKEIAAIARKKRGIPADALPASTAASSPTSSSAGEAPADADATE